MMLFLYSFAPARRWWLQNLRFESDIRCVFATIDSILKSQISVQFLANACDKVSCTLTTIPRKLVIDLFESARASLGAEAGLRYVIGIIVKGAFTALPSCRTSRPISPQDTRWGIWERIVNDGTRCPIHYVGHLTRLSKVPLRESAKWRSSTGTLTSAWILGPFFNIDSR